ncbi:hypothetical protein [Nonlabens ulvanivorans]|uniref:hypothetical protein n=1 Tax=Nonlabens ulvanivorans TaxID=906888 RepID=UPI002942A2AD|nr:hypothetical protein [Nonlabens ulvanivorans]WOI23498.1 hypothetical protein R1T42_03385 [Nonlabens ulvanivorans]
MKPTLELPKTLRPPEMDEVPMNSSVKERLELRKTAKIVEGYKILPKDDNPEHSNLAFNFYAEINIDNSKLWNLILELSNELPNEISLIFNHVDSEPNYGKYSEKTNTLEFLNKYKTEITSDTFIDFGMIFHSESELIEIFVPESKYIKFWGVDQESFLKIMDSFNLKEVDGIEFVDEYPKVREALRLFEKNIAESNELIELLKREFE